MTKEPVPRGRIRRTMPLAGFTARAAGGRLVAGLREKAGDEGAVERFHERTAERYTELLGHSKGVLMKAGQMFSTIDSSFSWDGAPSPYQKAMTRLQTQSPPMAPQLALQILESELGQPMDRLFAEFDEKPLSAASIGQVHRAVLHDGRQVAVKIQYTGVAEAIRDDLANTELLITFLRVALSLNGQRMAIDLRSAAAEIARQIAEEVDYLREAANIGTFNELLRGHPFIRVPEVIPEASTARVLTMTFVEGMSWTEAQKADQQLKDSWGEALWRFAIAPLFHQSCFYPDLHPGNYRFAEDGTLGIVDFGSVKPLSEHLRLSWCRMVSAYIDGRRNDLRAHMDEIDFFTADSTVTADECFAWMAESNAALQMPQPVTFTPEVVDRFFAMLNTEKPDNIVRRLAMPPDLIFFVRMPLGVQSVLSRLGATLEIRSIVREMLGTAEPTTPLGVQHVSWLRERGLPFGLEPRGQQKAGARP